MAIVDNWITIKEDVNYPPNLMMLVKARLSKNKEQQQIQEAKTMYKYLLFAK